MSYTHLTQDERYQIHEMLIEKKSKKDIALALSRSTTAIYRELNRNRGVHSWKPGQAQKLSETRQKNCRNARRIDEKDWAEVTDYLRLDLSPQQAVNRLSLEKKAPLTISHETIYQRIYADQKRGGDLVKHLRGQKPYRKRYGSGDQRRGAIKNRVSIDERPDIVAQKTRLGDWEGDTIIGKDQQGVVVTLVDRVSRFTLAERLDSKHADGVTAVINGLLTAHKQTCHTITFDNGKEFAGHQAMTACLQAAVYFAHPYHSWERGLNENTNGLIRQYFPKKTNFKNVSQEELQLAIHKLNHRPRKCLGYQTPYEVFYNLAILPLKTTRSCTS
jgi:transposase, IS30 family